MLRHHCVKNGLRGMWDYQVQAQCLHYENAKRNTKWIRPGLLLLDHNVVHEKMSLWRIEILVPFTNLDHIPKSNTRQNKAECIPQYLGCAVIIVNSAVCTGSPSGSSHREHLCSAVQLYNYMIMMALLHGRAFSITSHLWWKSIGGFPS